MPSSDARPTDADEVEVEGASPREPRGARIDFPCRNCGAGMTWDPGPDALCCAYCSTSVPVPRAEGTIVERALSEVGEAARGLGIAMRVTRCGTCGARVSFESASTAEQCVYCGSATVLDQETNRNALRPESLIPLTVSQAEVEQAFQRWIRGLWFRPGALKKTSRFHAVGVYVPFWTFDCRVHSSWSADAGYHYWVSVPYTTTVNGKTVVRMRQERRTRWVPAWGERDDVFDDELVLASRGLAPAMVERLGGFDTQGLVPYRPEYLAGWSAEEYQVDLEQGWALGQQAIEERQRARCAGDVPGDTHRFLRVENRIADVRWKHVLLPIWTLHYRWRGKDWSVLVHGVTGRVHGHAPLSVWKILIALALVTLVVAVIVAVIAVAR
jgi:predicted RNA-binding Zn-ribbon protein involved in translation (DUF1610 family)